MNAAQNITDRNKNPQSSFSHGKPEVKSDADFECNPLAAPFVEEVIKQLQAGETPEKEVYMTEHWFVNEDVLSTINVNGEDQDLTVVTKEIVDAQY